MLCPDCTASLTVSPRTMYTISSRGPQYITAVSAPYVFKGLMREAIHQFKYRNLRIAGETLGQFLADCYNRSPWTADVLVPVPLHPKRKRERGYNQAEILAAVTGELTGLPVAKALDRLQDTPSQALTGDAASRRQNVKSAFACPPGADIKNKNVLLVDDVVTSGATLNACARALRKAGAAEVRGLTVAMDTE